MTKLFEDVRRNLALTLRVHVASASNLVAAGGNDLDRLGKRNARERNGWHDHVKVEQALDVVAVLRFDSA